MVDATQVCPEWKDKRASWQRGQAKAKALRWEGFGMLEGGKKGRRAGVDRGWRWSGDGVWVQVTRVCKGPGEGEC